MTVNNPPCFGCEYRHAGCHAECPAYTAWRQEKDEENAQRNLESISRPVTDCWTMRKRSKAHRAREYRKKKEREQA